MLTRCRLRSFVVLFFVQFSAVTSRGVVMATSYVLAEHAEKLVAIMTLRQLQAKYVYMRRKLGFTYMILSSCFGDVVTNSMEQSSENPFYIIFSSAVVSSN